MLGESVGATTCTFPSCTICMMTFHQTVACSASAASHRQQPALICDDNEELCCSKNQRK